MVAWTIHVEIERTPPTIWYVPTFMTVTGCLTDVPGPIIRINPDELHINDPDYYDEMYNNNIVPVEKPAKAALVFGPYPAVGFPWCTEEQQKDSGRQFLESCFYPELSACREY